jgi:hypothetical protein
MIDRDSAFPPINAVEAKALIPSSSPGPTRATSKPALPCSSCAVSKIPYQMSWPKAGTSPLFQYSSSDAGWTFAEVYPPGQPAVFRNAVFHQGDAFEVQSVSHGALQNARISAVCISRNITSLENNCLSWCYYLVAVAFEGDPHVREIGPFAFSSSGGPRSIAVPSSVGLLGRDCFQLCTRLESVIFECPVKVVAIPAGAFWGCQSLRRLLIPASVRAIDEKAFVNSGIQSIEIEAGSVSFRVRNDLLVDFEVRSLVWVIGSPTSIVIPSSIEELRPFCSASNRELKTLAFESESALRSIGQFAFSGCGSLESICIPSSVELLARGAFWRCTNVRTVTFGQSH